jgi:excisionase family DNA binding protein
MSLKKIAGAEDLMTASDAGRILGVSVDTVRLMARAGDLPFKSTISGVRLFRRADVDELARRRKHDRSRSAVRRLR